MKIVSLLVLIFSIWSCNNCIVRCNSGEYFQASFTIRKGSDNLIATKKIEISNIKVYGVNSLSSDSLKVIFFDTQKDTSFLVSLKATYKNIKIKWDADSLDLEVRYNLIDSDCCPDQTVIKEMTVDGRKLKLSNGIYIINQ